MNTRNTLILILLALLTTLPSSGQDFQLPNGGFEQWSGTSLDAEPSHWSTFSSADGSYASLASANHHYRRSGGRPGTAGSHFLTLYTKSILGIKANGNMTTGRIHAGAMSASSPNNYNYTQRTNPAHACPFTATPDSMYLWVSYYAASATDSASVTCYLHGDSDFRDPNDWYTPSLYCGRAQVRFARTTASSSAYGWQQLRVPFRYDGQSAPLYALVSLTTNKTPGAGAANDSLSIDDIELVYSAWLTSISLNGIPLEGFQKGTLHYQIDGGLAEQFQLPALDFSTEVPDTYVAIDTLLSDSSACYTLHLTAEDHVTTRDYSLLFRLAATPADTVPPADTTFIAPILSPSLSVWPNPAGDEVVVDCAWGIGQLELFDLKGRRVLCCDLSSAPLPYALSLRSLGPGPYFLRASTPRGPLQARILKQ